MAAFNIFKFKFANIVFPPNLVTSHDCFLMPKFFTGIWKLSTYVRVKLMT